LNNKILSLIFLLCGFCLSACSTSNNITPFTPTAADADQAVVYIYRPTEMANALYSPGLNINGEFKLYARNGVNSRLSLPAGETLFEFQSEKKYSKLTPLSLVLETGDIYFIRVSTSLKINNSAGYERYERSFKLTRADDALATKEIAECCMDDNSPTEKAAAGSAEKKTSDEFSVDKTQNPFSH
jgi:hypothetical protein